MYTIFLHVLHAMQGNTAQAQTAYIAFSHQYPFLNFFLDGAHSKKKVCMHSSSTIKESKLSQFLRS
jgi:phage terminase large subunit